MNLLNSQSNITAVGIQHKTIDIIPSSQFFVINKIDPHTEIKIGNLIRVFASFHAGHSEIQLLSQYNLVSLHYDER